MVRSILAVLAGIAALTAASFAIEALVDPLLLHLFPQALPTRAAISQNLPSSLFMFAYTALCVVFGAYVTAWIANRAPVRHALIMGLLQLAFTVGAMVSLRDQAPLRNWISAIVFTMPCAWLGGTFRANQKSHPRVAATN